MRGTRYGDFSRFQPDPAPDATVLMQQGRVWLDADFNAQGDIAERRLQSVVADLIGGSGAPAHDPGFEIRPRIALAFSGGGRALVDDAPALRPDRCDPMTIEVWPQWRGGPGTILEWAGFEEWGPGALRIFVDEEGRLRVAMGKHHNEAVVLKARRRLPRTRIAHVVFTCGEHTMRLYLDGEHVAEAARTGPSIGPGQLMIGGRVEGPSPCFRGYLAGLRAWTIEHCPQPDEPWELDAPGLLAWWPMDEGHGDYARDLVVGRRAWLIGDPRPAWRIVDFDIEPGRYYVDGIPCNLDRRRRYSRQRLEPFAAPPTGPGSYLVYLETWEETVSPIQEPALADPALGGLDTTVRARTESAVRVVRLSRDRASEVDDPQALLDAGIATMGRAGRMAARHLGEDPPGNYLYRVEVHAGGYAGHEHRHEAAVADVHERRREVELAEPWPGELAAGTLVEICGCDRDGQEDAWLYVVAEAVRDERCVRLTTEPGAVADLRSLRLRVARPTFKWSRRNGAEVEAIEPVPAGHRQVVPTGARPGPPSIGEGDVVEVLDDDVVVDGPPPPLLRVTRVDPTDGALLLSEPVPHGVAGDAATHPFVRRWDQTCDPHAHSYAIPIDAGAWHDLELGVAVRFDAGHYRRGDYWWIVTRQDEPALQWPSGPDGPHAVEPEGIERRRAPLALALVGHHDVEVIDLRQTIVPATRPDVGIERPA
nr:LamG domain-containing protein [Actinomycetota bacterium]